MPTPTTKDAKQALYAVAGVADLAVSTIRHLPSEAAKMRSRIPGEAAKTYGQLVRRGETLVTGVRRSRPTRQASEATRNAVSRTKAANTRARSSAKIHPLLGEVGRHHGAPGRRCRRQGGQGRGRQGRREVTSKRR